MQFAVTHLELGVKLPPLLLKLFQVSLSFQLQFVLPLTALQRKRGRTVSNKATTVAPMGPSGPLCAHGGGWFHSRRPLACCW